jgi:hypothetical protein
MHRLLVGIVGAVSLCANVGLARAADAPSLVGTWTGTGPSVSASDGWETGRTYTIVVTEQQGSVFKARGERQGGQDEMLGVIRADGQMILFSNSDGVSTGMLLGPDRFESCYVGGGDDAMATCMIMTKTK